MIFKTGDHVHLTVDGRTVAATVALASQNGRSLALTYEAILCGWAGMMPVLLEADGNFYALSGEVVTIESGQLKE